MDEEMMRRIPIVKMVISNHIRRAAEARRVRAEMS